jgi:hypothetical protein
MGNTSSTPTAKPSKEQIEYEKLKEAYKGEIFLAQKVNYCDRVLNHMREPYIVFSEKEFSYSGGLSYVRAR